MELFTVEINWQMSKQNCGSVHFHKPRQLYMLWQLSQNISCDQNIPEKLLLQ